MKTIILNFVKKLKKNGAEFKTRATTSSPSNKISYNIGVSDGPT